MQSTNGPPIDVQAPPELAPFIDHTLLKPDATAADVERLCEEALRFGFKGVCVNSAFVARAAARLQGSAVLPVSVVGFPLGAMLTDAKARETELAVAAGAREIDVVIALGAVKAGDFASAENDVRAIVRAAGAAPVKVIIETGLLTADEIAASCRASEAAGAAFVKTATGFLGRGATLEDIVLMKRSCSPGMRIKASGGVRTFATARDLLRAGACRLGTSNGVALMADGVAGAGY